MCAVGVEDGCYLLCGWWLDDAVPMIVVAVCCSSVVWLSIRNVVGFRARQIRFDRRAGESSSVRDQYHIQCIVQSGGGEQGIDKTIREQGNLSEWEGW